MQFILRLNRGTYMGNHDARPNSGSKDDPFRFRFSFWKGKNEMSQAILIQKEKRKEGEDSFKGTLHFVFPLTG